jgi:hypothetical protein
MKKSHRSHARTYCIGTASLHIPRYLFGILLLVLLLTPVWAQQAASVSWDPQTLDSGSPCMFTVRSPGSTAVTGTWQGHPLEFFHAAHDPATWYAIGGVDVAAKPGTYPLEITVTSATQTQSLHRVVEISPASYKEIPLSVPQKFVEPDAASQKIIAADQELKRKVFADSSSVPLFSGRFLSPLKSAPSTDSFGTRRVFNGTLASVHRGLDYRARMRTPVRSANSGRVVLARPLYFEGNCVVIDHGLGLTTIYMHLSKFEVKEGESVTRGQLIALSGRTGRANGPHLHLSVRWQGGYLDPAKLFLLRLPAPARR